jgi:hypothetical protein
MPLVVVHELLNRFTDDPSRLTFGAAKLICRQILASIEVGNYEDVVLEVDKAVRAANTQWEEYPSTREGLSKLLLAFASFVLHNGADNESERLLLVGLNDTLIRPTGERHQPVDAMTQFYARDVLSSLSPLLERVDNSILRSCIQIGLQSDVPEIRACCRVMAALAGTL